MPERKDNQLLPGHAIVDVVPGAREVEPPNVSVMPRTAASAYAGLLPEYFERFSQVQADGIWCCGAVVRPPHGGSFNLS
jgi:hypothetical protein